MVIRKNFFLVPQPKELRLGKSLHTQEKEPAHEGTEANTRYIGKVAYLVFKSKKLLELNMRENYPYVYWRGDFFPFPSSLSSFFFFFFCFEMGLSHWVWRTVLINYYGHEINL